MIMHRSAPAALALALVAFAPLAVCHEMFLKSEGYELEPGPQQVVRLLNGTFDIDSSPGHGTSIVAWLPAEGGRR